MTVFDRTCFWEGYEGLLALVLVLAMPLMGFAVGYVRGGKDFVKRTWKWVAVYYVLAAISTIPFFVLHIAIYASCLVWSASPLLAAILIAEGFMIAGRQSREPLCEYCGYNLIGNVSGVCPECGRPVNWKPDYDLFTEDPIRQTEGDMGDEVEDKGSQSV